MYPPEPMITIPLSLLEDLTDAAQYAVSIANELLAVPDYESPDFNALITLRGWAESAHTRGMDVQRQYHDVPPPEPVVTADEKKYDTTDYTAQADYYDGVSRGQHD